MTQSLLVLVALFCQHFLFCDLRSSIFEQGGGRILVLLNERFVQISDDVV